MEAAVEITQVGAVARVTVHRGKVNALDPALLEELATALDGLAGDEAVGSVVLTGAGRVFSAGVDLHWVSNADDGEVHRLIAALRGGLEALFAFPKPTVAAVNGAAVAGGCVLACACDHRLAVAGAGIGATELAVGVPFPLSALEILHHACGVATERVVLGARLLSAQEAMAIGMVHEVVPPDELEARAMAIAAELGEMPAFAYASAKRLLRAPALAAMRDYETIDGEVARQWASAPTRRRIGEQLQAMARRG